MRSFDDVASLVRGARQGLSQREFARAIGATQSMVSRYERGVSSPPAAVVNACMHLMHENSGEYEIVSVEQLASKVISKLGNPGFAHLRSVMAQLIDGMAIRTDIARVTRENIKS